LGILLQLLRKITMKLTEIMELVVLIFTLLLMSTSFAQTNTEDKKTELEKKVERLQDVTETRLPSAELAVPKVAGPLFSVKELRINGNTLVSTSELLGKLPLSYTVSVPKDETVVEQTYDFRVLHEIIREPGTTRQVPLKTLQGLTRYILSVYQDKGYAGIYVFVPAEAVEGEAKLVNQILPIQVLEGKVAQLTVKRYDFDRQEQQKGFLKDSVIQSWSPVQTGDVIQKKELDDFVNLLNLNPDRYIAAVISRSVEPDALNISYDVYEVDPWHLYVQLDNAGTEARQWSPRVGLINTNLTGMDDRFSAMYQAPWEAGMEDEYSVFGSYDFPLFTPRLRLNFYAGYSQFDVTPEGGINFIGNGSFYGTILSYNVFQMDDWFVDVTGSLSREKSKVTPSLGLQSDVDMDLWGVGVNLHRSVDISNTSVGFNRTERMGGSGKNDFALARVNTEPDFIIYTFSASHSRYLETDKVNRVSGSFRMINSNERLVPAKETTFGGLYSVRGYKEDEIVADGGILASGQYEFDIVKYFESEESGLEQKQEEKGWLRKLAPLAFVDYGRAKIKHPVATEKRVQELCSVGTGLMVDIGESFTGGIYYGWPLRGTDDTDKNNGRFNFNFILRW
jgi:hemolysin activation/secretion protein